MPGVKFPSFIPRLFNIKPDTGCQGKYSPKGSKCFVLFDCCHSGSGLDLKYNFNSTELSLNFNPPLTEGIVILLSGCSDSQTAADTVDINNKPSGALTNSFIKLFKNDYNIKVSFESMLLNIRNDLRNNGYLQIPQLSSNYLFLPNMNFDMN